MSRARPAALLALAALVLFLVTLGLNILSRKLSARYREVYD